MAQRGLTELLNAHHDKLNKHTVQIAKLEEQIAELKASVTTFEQQTAQAADEDSGLRAGLRDWIASIRELM